MYNSTPFTFGSSNLSIWSVSLKTNPEPLNSPTTVDSAAETGCGGIVPNDKVVANAAEPIILANVGTFVFDASRLVVVVCEMRCCSTTPSCQLSIINKNGMVVTATKLQQHKQDAARAFH